MRRQGSIEELDPQFSLGEMQAYIRKVLVERGLADQPIQNSLLLLCEEVGELAKAIRKNTKGMSVEANKADNFSVAEELADILIILGEIANVAGISLADAFVAKEKINAGRSWDLVDGEK